MSKRFVSIVISFILLFSCLFICTSFAEESENNFEEYNQLLIKLKIADEKLYENESVSRIDFLSSALNLIRSNPDFLQSDISVNFGDVQEDTLPILKTAVALSLISDSDSFRPNDSITFSESLKIIVSALGYNELAELKGGYPYGYFVVARDIDLVDGISEFSGVINTDIFNGLFVNALNCSPAKIVSVKNQNIKIDINTDDSLMNLYFDLYKDEGIVEANSRTTLFSNDMLSKNEIRIGNTVYKTLDNMQDYLGYYVEVYYYSTNKKMHDVIFIKSDESKCREYDITYINYADDEGNEKFKYMENNKLKEISVAENASFIYNEVLVPKSSVSMYPDVGNTVIIDNNGDSKADVVKIYDYKTAVVASKSDYDNIICLTDGSFIDLGNGEDETDIYLNGESASYNTIKKENILSYYETKLGGYYYKKILVSDCLINGKIESVGEDEVTVNNQSYRYDPQLKDSLKPGENAELYIDAFSRVARVKNNDERFVYGWLYAINRIGLSDIKMKIFTENARWVELKVKDKVKFDNKLTDSELMYNNFKGMNPVSQLIRYMVNDDAQIVRLDTATVINRWSEEEKAAIDSGKFRISFSADGLQYRSGTKSVDDKIYQDSDTKVFCIPADESDLDSYSVISSIGDAYGNDSTIASIKAYDMNLMGTAGAVVIKDTVFKSYDDIFVLNSISSALNSTKDEVYCVNGFFKGSLISLYTRDMDCIDINSYSAGDVVRPRFNMDGTIEKLDLLFTLGNGDKQKFQNGNLYDRSGTAAGLVKEIDFSLKRIAVDVGSAINLYTLNAKNVCVYDSKLKKCMSGSISDIAVGDYIFARISYLNCADIVVYK